MRKHTGEEKAIMKPLTFLTSHFTALVYVLRVGATNKLPFLSVHKNTFASSQ